MRLLTLGLAVCLILQPASPVTPPQQVDPGVFQETALLEPVTWAWNQITPWPAWRFRRQALALLALGILGSVHAAAQTAGPAQIPDPRPAVAAPVDPLRSLRGEFHQFIKDFRPRSGTFPADIGAAMDASLADFQEALDHAGIFPEGESQFAAFYITGAARQLPDGRWIAAYRLFINPKVMTPLLRLAETHSLYRQFLIAIILKLGASMNLMKTQPDFYAAMNADEKRWEEIKKFNYKDETQRQLVKDLVARKLEAFSTGSELALDYLNLSPDILSLAAKSIHDPSIAGAINRLAVLAKSVEGKTGEERELAMRANHLEELRTDRTMKTLYYAIMKIKKIEKKKDFRFLWPLSEPTPAPAAVPPPAQPLAAAA